MKIMLAPMDGITDFHVRQLLTSIGGFDLAFTEFLRVTKSKFPTRTFYHNCPEIDPQVNTQENNISNTLSGTPVHIQLLGSHEGYMAENAIKAVELGAKGIDINLGCPAKTVNGHGGGAVLLKNPEKLFSLISSVRKALPHNIPLSAKMRLGYEDSSLLLENALAIEAAGVDFITIHARTKMDGYRPPAKWHEVANLYTKISIPIVLNGEIWNTDDYYRCHQITHCKDIMLARGAFARPDLAKQIKASVDHKSISIMPWDAVLEMLINFYQVMMKEQLVSKKYIAGRLKLWIKWLMASYDEAVILFEQIKSIKDPEQVYLNLKKFNPNLTLA